MVYILKFESFKQFYIDEVYQIKNPGKVTPRSSQSNPKAAKKLTLILMKLTPSNGKVRMFAFKMVMNMGYFISHGITLLNQSRYIAPNNRVTLIDLLCKFTVKCHFYLKNKFEEVSEKIRMFLHTGM